MPRSTEAHRAHGTSIAGAVLDISHRSSSDFFLEPILETDDERGDAYSGNGGSNLYCKRPDTVALGICVAPNNICYNFKKTALRCQKYSKIQLNYKDCEPHYAVNQSIPMICGDDKFAFQYCRASGTATTNCGIDYLGAMTEGYVSSIDGSAFTRFTNSYMTDTLGYFPMTSTMCCSLNITCPPDVSESDTSLFDSYLYDINDAWYSWNFDTWNDTYHHISLCYDLTSLSNRIFKDAYLWDCMPADWPCDYGLSCRCDRPSSDAISDRPHTSSRLNWFDPGCGVGRKKVNLT